MGLKESLEEPVSRYMSKDYAKVSEGESVQLAAAEMKKMGATEAVVMKGKAPVGIITERDILYKVVASGLAPQQAKAVDVMSSPIEGIDEEATVAEAISKMAKLGLRRLVVTRKGELVGMVTQKQVVSGARGQDVALPELAKPNGVSCPYCDAVLKTQQELSKHIDQVHLGLGLLEGDRSKW